MCVVSNVTGYGRDLWPHPSVVPAGDYSKLAVFNELIQTARKFDEVAKQQDSQDPEKENWEQEFQDRIAQLEKEIEYRKRIQDLEQELEFVKNSSRSPERPQLLFDMNDYTEEE